MARKSKAKLHNQSMLRKICEAQGIDPKSDDAQRIRSTIGRQANAKQVLRAINSKRCHSVYVGEDAEPWQSHSHGERLSLNARRYDPLQSNWGGATLARQSRKVGGCRDRDDRVRARASSKGKRRATGERRIDPAHYMTGRTLVID